MPAPIRPAATITVSTRSRTAIIAAAVGLTFQLTGCASGKDTILPQGGPTMKAVYDAHFDRRRQHDGETARQQLGPRAALSDGVNPTGWTREADTEIQQIFPRLPNPDLVMYVFPHLSADGHPVPGYATSFPMYESVQYALPGEAEGR